LLDSAHCKNITCNLSGDQALWKLLRKRYSA
jgi:hypothetical protein